MNIIQMSISGGAMIIVIALIRILFYHRLPKRTFPILWAAAAIRLLIPYSMPCSFSIFSLRGEEQKAYQAAVTSPAVYKYDFSLKSAFYGVRAEDILTVIWIIGILLCAAFFIYSYVKSVRRFRESLPFNSDFVKEFLTSRSLSRKTSVRCSDRISTPLTYGIFRPTILIPKKLEQIGNEDLEFVLTHEYIHIRRFDALFKLVLTAVLCLHWFNPLVWLMYVLANRDIELSCDDGVIHMLGESKKEAYALSLIHMEESKSGLYPLVNHYGKNAVKERIIAIMKFKKNAWWAAAIAACLVIGSAAVFATTSETSDTDVAQQTSGAIETAAEDLSAAATEVTENRAEAVTTAVTMSEPNTELPESGDISDNEEETPTEITLILEQGEEITMPQDGGAYLISVDTDENGNRVVHYSEIEVNTALVAAQTDNYSHEIVDEDGILRW